PALERRAGDHAMSSVSTTSERSQPTREPRCQLFDDWFDPIETAVRDRVRGFIEELIRNELDAVLARPRYGRRAKEADDEQEPGVAGHRHGSRSRSLMGTFGKTEIEV